jgi:hypothetical protein
VNEDVVAALCGGDEAETSVIVPGLQDAIEAHVGNSSYSRLFAPECGPSISTRAHLLDADAGRCMSVLAPCS